MTNRRKRKETNTDEAAPPSGVCGHLVGEKGCEALRGRVAEIANLLDLPDIPEDLAEGVVLFNLLFEYAERCLTPQRMAELRRERGDDAASPRDYDCRCPVPKADGLPDCLPNAVHCRFRHLMRPRPKACDNGFAHELAREIFEDLFGRWPQIAEREQDAMIEKAITFIEADSKRIARMLAGPRPEPAPLMEHWRKYDVR